MTKKKLSGQKTQRKRSNKGAVQAVMMDKNKLTPIVQQEANLFQQAIQISNQYAKLRKQEKEYEIILQAMKDKRKDVVDGKVDQIMLPFGKNKFYPCSDKKQILKELDSEIDILANALKGVSGQVVQFRDALIEQGLAIRQWSDDKFGKYKPKNTYTKGCSPKKEETVLFEGELDELMKNEEMQEKFKEAKEQAVKENKKLNK